MEENITINSQALGGSSLKAKVCKIPDSKFVALLSHNASGSMDNPLIKILAKELQTRGVSTLRYNFHYVEGVGSEAAEWVDVEKDGEAAYETLAKLFPNQKYLLIGKSLGTLISLVLSSRNPDQVAKVGLFSLPIGMCKKYLNLSNWQKISARVILYQGEQDHLGTVPEAKEFLLTLAEDVEVVPMSEAGHGFEKQFSEDALRKTVEHFLNDLLV